jgi:hypothetical protein
MADEIAMVYDVYGNPIQLIPLSRSQDVVASSTTSVKSTAINGHAVRIHAHDTEIRFLIGDEPEAEATSHYLAPYEAIDQPIVSGQKVAIYGGIASISVLGK